MAPRKRLKKAAAWLEDHARSVLLGPPGIAHINRGSRPTDERLRFLFTIDTEISMGGALADSSLEPVGPEQRIWGQTSSGTAGIDLFMDLFDEFDMKGVFFFEVCGRNVVEEASLERAAKHIHARGHDVELHVHPEFRVDIEAVRAGTAEKPSALFHSYSHAEQVKLLRSTAERLHAWTGRWPSTFRAGGFGADERTMAALKTAGVPIDSSYNMWSIELETCQFDCRPALNDVALLAPGVLEVPVTCYRAAGPRGGLRQFDLAAINATEAIAVLEDLYSAGTRVCTSLTHSFRLLHTTDIQYGDARPDTFNIHRVRALCRFLHDNRDRFEVCTYRDLPLERWQEELATPRRAPYVPSPPAWTSLARLAVQAAKDRGAL